MSSPASSLKILQLTRPPSANDSTPSPASDGQTPTAHSAALLADLIPILVVVLYAFGIICWFRDRLASLCSWREFRTWRWGKSKDRKGGYVNVAKEDDHHEEEEAISLQPTSQMRPPQHDEESAMVSRTQSPSNSSLSRKRKKRPKSLVLRGYTPLPSFPEETGDDDDDGREPEQKFHRALLQRKEDSSSEEQLGQWHDLLGLSRYFDGSTGQLQRHILLDPETELSQMRMKEENGMFEYNGGLGDNLIGRWFDRAVHWMVTGAQAWLAPEESSEIAESRWERDRINDLDGTDAERADIEELRDCG
ncbi:hypothetical protein PRK78_001459 [Emydomyces testavorans]|uniref:Uncharacterized protein n=1 Tax=Emydomyces testavorans TaxID=2070801 RepID=A0AAF0IIP4_9EURO|nr:hypothetical protein PRK78_001459 [Emydomyces testavorans]